MQVIESGPFTALCERRGEQRRLNMMLIGPQPVGTWVLAIMDHAREVLDEVQARQIDEAVLGLEAALQGANELDGYFPDLALPSQMGPPR